MRHDEAARERDAAAKKAAAASAAAAEKRAAHTAAVAARRAEWEREREQRIGFESASAAAVDAINAGCVPCCDALVPRRMRDSGVLPRVSGEAADS